MVIYDILSLPVGQKGDAMQVIAVGGCSHTGDFGTYAPGSYPAIVAAVNRDMAVGLTIHHTVDWQLIVSEQRPAAGTLEELQKMGVVSDRTGDQVHPPPFEFILERLIGSEGHHIPMFLHLPELGTAAELAELCRTLKRSPGIVAHQVRLCSSRLEVLQECQQHLPEFFRIWEATLGTMPSHRIERIISDVELTGISLKPDEIHSPLVNWLSMKKVSVRLQSIDEFSQLSQFGQWGVAGVFTSHPSGVADYIKNWNTPTKYNPRLRP